MVKRLFLSIMVLGFAAFLGFAHAEDVKINNYYFVWYAASVGDVHMDIEKTQEGLKVLLSSPGGALARISPAPATAVAIGEALKRDTVTYYDKQMKKEDYNAEDMVPVGGYKIYYRSSRGQKFEVSVRAPGVISAAVIMTKDEALKIADSLLKAETMAALVDKRIQP
ncbi:MAG: hypothetical protein U5R49_25665 [Deltaproteobacteria bacterium]|nr:hypothetical protein [Deltaproteobacteria bacterium]